MTEIWGHRGACHFLPENTLSSFQLAADMGADGVEFDIQLTKDGEIVVIHDETIDRTSNGEGCVKNYTLSEIKRFNFCREQEAAVSEFMEIPTLAETLELLKRTRLKINVELKTGIVFYEDIERKALALAEKYGMMERIVWSSFNHYSVQKIKQIEPWADIALLCGGGILVTGEQCEKIGASALHPQTKQLYYPGLAKECRDRGIKIRTWTVNKPEDFQLALDNGVDGVFTNRIDVAKQLIQTKADK